MSEVIKVNITTTQRQLLVTLVQHDSIGQVYAIISDNRQDIAAATHKIINHLDFLFEVRVALMAMPPQGGAIALSEIARAYLTALLDHFNAELLSPELRATYARDREDLQMKMGDLKQGFLLPYIRKMVQKLS